MLLVVSLLSPLSAAAQAPPVPVPSPNTAKLAWDHDGVNTDGYALAIDGTRAVVQATCAVVATVRSCEMPFPALTPGDHVLIVSAFNAAGEAAADPFRVTVFVAPTKPTNTRIK
jgi:hypothetical protein